MSTNSTQISHGVIPTKGRKPTRVRLIICDDHPIMREGLRMVLKEVSGIEVVGEANDGADAVWLVQRLTPDVVIMDLRMSGMDGIEATRRIHEMSPKTAVIVFTVYDDEDLLVRAVQAGASGYLLKDSPVDLILHCIYSVMEGGLLFRTEVLAKALASLVGKYERVEMLHEPERAVVLELTPRERSVLELLVQGLSNKEIGARLAISDSTVKRHVQTITEKLGVEDRTGAAVTALRFGLVR